MTAKQAFPAEACRGALGCCAQDLGVPEAELRLIRGAPTTEHYNGQIFFVGLRGAAEVRTHVIKIGTGAWSPQNEFEALRFTARALADAAELPGGRLSVIEATAYSLEPKFLVTRFQSGRSPQPTLDAAIRGWRRNRPIAEARSFIRLLAHWLAAFRRASMTAEGGIEPTAYLELNLRNVDELRRSVGRRRLPDRLTGVLEGYMTQLTREDRLRMSRSSAQRGDCRPKNFLVDDHGAIYALDLEGFGFGPLEHDLSCMRISLERGALGSRAAARRASLLWTDFWDCYMRFGNSPRLALLGYLHSLLGHIVVRAAEDPTGGVGRRLRTTLWIRDRLRWLGRLEGDLDADASYLRGKI